MPKARHAIALVLLLAGCASAGPSAPATSNPADAAAVRIYKSFYPALDGAAQVYAAVNNGVRLAHQAGVLSDAKLAKVTPRLTETYMLLEAAKATVDTYFAALEAGSVGASPTASFLAALEAAAKLLQVAQELGMTP